MELFLECGSRIVSQSMSKKFLIELIGWYGVGAILLAYILITFSVVAANSGLYQILNLTGALGIVVDAYNQKNYQPAVLNTFWALIAFFALAKIFFF